MNKWPDDDVILFDGVCIFCSRWVRFVAARDTARRFRFTPIPLRNSVYNLVARNRYRIFGKYDACFVPDADLRARVIE
ncbi:DCC1-like thiol-disulfide oxidoreductase family protein [Bradyrhizobium sp. CB82]|uniref:thiol-disulfide oxidoreductase DCC family protein n=1 Tax=Bradyrhizobium sp. CB82 TaxID=3039159 RepID=UPI0024B24E08|nr:DCC1-like thiol-disulfide oxidoreductase family protein [Bradyrhizobium sp. CB82]WFU41225.1 DCC1-like thiol-disulfide oxidoreductase family protein [Bradyrhizobium sp. CB82]